MEATTALGFVAVNYIDCTDAYIPRFEELFSSRVGAIDRLPGFRNMHVLRPQKVGDAYLIVSYWDDESHFQAWTKSPEFLEGHKRGFDDIRKAREQGGEAPMKSTFKTYEILSN